MEWVALGDNEFPGVKFLQAEVLRLFMEDVFKVVDAVPGRVELENFSCPPSPTILWNTFVMRFFPLHIGNKINNKKKWGESVFKISYIKKNYNRSIKIVSIFKNKCIKSCNSYECSPLNSFPETLFLTQNEFYPEKLISLLYNYISFWFKVAFPTFIHLSHSDLVSDFGYFQKSNLVIKDLYVGWLYELVFTRCLCLIINNTSPHSLNCSDYGHSSYIPPLRIFSSSFFRHQRQLRREVKKSF